VISLFWLARYSIIEYSPLKVALQKTIWGQYRANCEVAGTPYVYNKCARAECRPVEPYTIMYAAGEGVLEPYRRRKRKKCYAFGRVLTGELGGRFSVVWLSFCAETSGQ